MNKRLTFLITLLLLTATLIACGDDNAPLSTGEQGGQIAAPDTLEGADEATSGDNVAPGDAETIGGDAGPGGATTGGDVVGDNGPVEEAGNQNDNANDQTSGGSAMPAFLSDWESGGATVEVGGDLPGSPFEGAGGQTYFVNGAEVQVYEFADAAAAEAAAATISPDGGMIGDVSVRWAGPPHLYRQDNRIIVFIGDDADTLDLLNTSFGSPFAGTGTSE